MLRFASHLFFEHLYDGFVRNVFVGFRIGWGVVIQRSGATKNLVDRFVDEYEILRFALNDKYVISLNSQ